ncbi:extracellular solute-binding protein [Streptomyces sp. NPDC093598]|uniref:extracellular solute-binding protein n=1 Tax=Streptomyces sp. NPDC093598 TaxID=3366046 RepID=UPI00382EFACF
MRGGREQRPGAARRGVSTRRLLLRHLWAFLGCAAVGVSLLTAVAVPQLDARVRELRDDVAPSVRGSAAVRLAVLRADEAARHSIEREVAGTVGAGETAQSQLAAADQGLTQLADHVGSGMDQDISAVNGLLEAYSNAITLATVKYQADGEMRSEKLAEADALLNRPDTGLLDRLDKVANAERHRAGELSEPGVLLTAAWVVAAASLAAAATVAGLACRVISRRCGRLLAPWILAGAAAPMALATVPAFLAWRTAQGLNTARDHLRDILHIALTDSLQGNARALTAAQQQVAATGLPDLSAFGWWNGVYVVVGLAGICAAVAGLVARLTTDYPERPVDWSWARGSWNRATRTRGRRWIAAAAALAVLAAIATPQLLERNPVVTVLGPWTGKEEQRFRGLMEAAGIRVSYQGTPAQREVLLSRVQAGDPPDIAIMPGIGELAEYRAEKHLKPLDDLVEELRYAGPWRPDGKGQTYWWPVNANLKSIVWQSRDAVGHPGNLSSWCLGMGEDGAAGWPGTDWIEDIVLQRAGPGVYADWARGSGKNASTVWTKGPVREAWRQWARFLATDRGRAEQALTTDWRGPAALKRRNTAFRETTPRCALEHQGSFAQGDDGARLTDAAPLLPGGPYRTRAYEVSGDFAALFNDREPARKALRALFSEDGQERWAGQGTMYSAMLPVMTEIADHGDVDSTARAIYGRFRQTAVPRCLDASDVMRPAVRDAFHEAVLRTVAAVAGGGLSDEDLDDILGGVKKVQEVTDQNEDIEELRVCSEPRA